MSVDLPLPLGPMMARYSLRRICKLTPRSARTTSSPMTYSLVMFSMSITTGPGGLIEFRVSIVTSTVARRDYFIPSLSRATFAPSFNFLWTQIALASANRHGLHRHGYDVLYLVCVNVGGATQRRLQLHIVVFDPDFHLKVGDLFLCAGAGCLSRVTNLINGAVEFPIAIGVDFYFSLVTQLHIHNVVLVHIDPRLHVTEVGNAHYFRAGELPRGYKTFAQFAVENCDR